jgi:hypothetical protein
MRPFHPEEEIGASYPSHMSRLAAAATPNDSCEPSQCIPTICVPAADSDSAHEAARSASCGPNDGCDPNHCDPDCDPGPDDALSPRGIAQVS